MKKTTSLLIIALISTAPSLAQDIDPAKPTREQAYLNLRDVLQCLLKDYSCERTPGKKVKAVQSQVLNDNLYGIYEAIIPNAQGLSDNGSAFTYAHNADKQTLGLSAFYPLQGKKTFLNVGVYTEATEGIFSIYSSNSWSNNAALNIGVSRVFVASQFFSPKDCRKIAPKRQDYADSLLLAYGNSLAVDIIKLKKDSASIVLKIDSLKKGDVLHQVESDTTDYLKKLKEVRGKIERYMYLVDIVRQNKHRTELESQLTKFDKMNDVLYGYNVIWLNANSSLANTHLNITDSLHVGNKRSVNHPTLRFDGSAMYNRLGKYTLQYLSIGASAMRGSFLNDPTLTGKPAIHDDGGKSNVTMGNERVPGTFDDLRKPVWQYTLSIYYANFFAANKCFGLSARLAHNNVFNNKYASDYQRNYTLTAGPIFRLFKEKDFAKATFGINTGWTNVPYGEKPKDHFAVQAFVALPFKATLKNSK